jgi:D-3-phosphoglycerate dehydrogenase / 2-oxoglutarate reductase
VSRVLIGDPAFPLEEARSALAGFTVERARPPWVGKDVVGLLVSDREHVGDADLVRLPALRVIATTTTGLDHVEVESAARRGIEVRNVPDYCTEEAADTTIALLLALLRGVVQLDRSVGAGRWDYAAAGPLRRVAGTRLGIAGFGRIGRAVARRALALDVEIWATDPLVAPREIAAAGARPAGLHELLTACAALTLHAPLTQDTEGLIGARELALMPRGALLVNTARGRLVDVDAVLAALESGQLGGAALDVLPDEPPERMLEAPGLIVTPHAAWYSPEAEREARARAVAELRAVLESP